MKELFSISYDVCKTTPAETLEKFCEILDSREDINQGQLLVDMESKLPSGKYTDKLKAILSMCEVVGISSSKILAATLRSLSYANERQISDLITEIVWTGPQVKGVPLRPTDTVLNELISNSRKEVLIVSFVVYKAEDVAKKLKEALDRGVSVTFVIESSEDSGGRMSNDGIGTLGKEIIDRSKIYYWPREKRLEFSPDINSSLHVKCAISDDREVLISSANLTKNALKHNMEMGLRVINESLSTRVKKHFKELIHTGVLIER